MVWDATATGSAGTNYVEDWRDTPTTNWTRALSVAQYPKLATNWIARSSATNVIEAALSSDTGTNVLLAIGDSTTDGSAWLTPMAAIDAADANMVVTSIGTQTDGGINHEGRSGWTTALFVGETSPFWDGAGFSTEHYLTNNALVTPTHVVIKLGINDLFSDTTDSSADSTITSVMSRFATMVNNITNYVSGVKVGICLVEPCSRDQDAWGANYLSGQLGLRARRNYWKMNLSLIAAYGGRTAEGLYVIPTNVCIDDYWGYARATVAVNSREATTITRMSNGVHPGTSGNAQIADCIWAWLKNNP
jgi:lysophospholipase L1-like esterase